MPRRTKLQLNIAHLYPKEMNIYGDYGNIITLVKRCEWRNIKVEVDDVNQKDKIKPGRYDVYFIGGGQDKDQMNVCEDLKNFKSAQIREDVENDVVILSICGGYQLLGRSFLSGDGYEIPGIGILNVETKAAARHIRCVGNIVAETRQTGRDQSLVGFENHSGQTFLGGKMVKPLARVVSGYGNNVKDETEGAVYKSVFGTYMHGSFLPKNPHFADHLIKLALKRRYKDEIKLKRLGDSEEWGAHRYIVERSR